VGKPYFTIVIPAYDRIAELTLTLDYLQAQTFPQEETEVIVIDDSPMSNAPLTWNVVNELGYTYVWRHLRNVKRPVSSARKCGAAMARGKIVLWLDQDILLRYDSLLKIAKVHDTYSDIVVYPNIQISPHTYETYLNIPISKVDQHFDQFGEVGAVDGGEIGGNMPGELWSNSEEPLPVFFHFGTTGMSLSRELAMSHDLWDCDMPGYAFDDIDFALACHTGKLRSVCCTDIRGIHMLHDRRRYDHHDHRAAHAYLIHKWQEQRGIDLSWLPKEEQIWATIMSHFWNV